MKVKETNVVQEPSELRFLQPLALLEVRLEQVSRRLNDLESKLQPILGPLTSTETVPAEKTLDDIPQVSARLQKAADFVDRIADQLHDLYLRA